MSLGEKSHILTDEQKKNPNKYPTDYKISIISKTNFSEKIDI